MKVIVLKRHCSIVAGLDFKKQKETRVSARKDKAREDGRGMKRSPFHAREQLEQTVSETLNPE
jgi:hypothetical protein